MPHTRNYRKEYDTYHKTERQKKRRAGRNKARSLVVKKRGKAAVQGKDVHHADRNTTNNNLSNLKIQSKKQNRGNNK
jgi:hypothetical protein|tara:strand:+ start:233 stop:463 length:231 start_codon:yes stop_codon:yes gene_type:complete